MFRESTWIRSRAYDSPNFGDRLFPDDEHLKIPELKSKILKHSLDEDTNFDKNHERFSYCYLCSIGEHEHKKTEPVPVNKRRYLRPYLNPVQLIKKYEKNQQDHENKTKYKFIVKTGNGQFAGTDSNVMFKLYGSAGVWEEGEIKPKSQNSVKFPANSLVETEISGPLIGDLKKIKIWHNGKSIKEGWYLDYIEITCLSQMQTWRFVCDQWLSTHKPPNYSNSIVLTLGQSVFDNEITHNMTEYFFIFKTSSKPLTGRDLNIQFQFTATKFQSQVFNLLTPYVNLFDKNQLDCFMVSCSHDLGAPEKLRLAHNARKMGYDWSIDQIKVIYSKQPNKIYLYKVDSWLDKNDRMNAIISFNSDVPINKSEGLDQGKKIYHVSVITGNVKLAGTDARVFIEIQGSKGVTKRHRLHNAKKREFERGQIDHFHIFDDDVGELKKIRVSHDNSGSAPGWFLDAVLIRSVGTTITGSETKLDSELFSQLDRLKKKMKIKNLKPEDLEKLDPKKPKRSKSAELTRKTHRSKVPKRTRSVSVSLKSKSDDKLNQSLESSRSSPTPSILKTSASPRTRRDMMKKHVKFEDKKQEKSPKTEKPSQTKIDMTVNWLMSVNYLEDSKSIKSIRTIENYDKSIKSIDSKLVSLFESKYNKSLAKPAEATTQSEPKKTINENLIYVFECNKWLARDKEDRQIERVLKLSNVLPN